MYTVIINTFYLKRNVKAADYLATTIIFFNRSRLFKSTCLSIDACITYS